MSVDLMMLVWSAILCVALALPYTTALVLQLGLSTMVGNRDNFPHIEGWIGRAQRAHRNMLENMAPFAALVIAAHLGGKADPMTAMGAQVFFYARVIHALVYIGGIAWIRTLAYAASLAGMVMILYPILK